MGNMTSLALGAFRTATFDYSGTTPKLTRVTENGVPRAVEYDAAGNERLVGATSSTYSPRNQLLSSAGLAYEYDGRGVRVRTVVTGFGGGLPPRGSDQISIYLPELKLMAERDYWSITPVTWDYVWFGDQPLAQIRYGTHETRWTFNDHLGTPLLQTDAAGAVVWRLEQEPYGADGVFRAGSSLHQPLRFPGQERGVESELAYNVFRWFDPSRGLFTQADPAGLHLKGSFQGLNHVFGYADRNPLLRMDRLGLVPTSGCMTSEISLINDAVSKATKVLASCLPCNSKEKTAAYKKKLQNTTYHCVNEFEMGALGLPSNTCANARKPQGDKMIVTGTDVTLTPKGLNGDCGCLESVLLHEIVHLFIGNQEDKAYSIAAGCFECAIQSW